MTQNKKGFTLIELVVVMAIIAVLAMLGVGAIIAARNAAKETTNKANAKSLQVGIEAGFAKYAKYCGATGQIACSTYNFADLAGDTTQGAATAITGNLGISLSSSTCATGATATAPRAGGGSVTLTAAGVGYTITPYGAACGASDNLVPITGP